MTYEELKAEANRQGYRLVKQSRPEKLLPCICGHNKRTHRFSHNFYVLECKNCGSIVRAETEKEVYSEWNKFMTKLREENQNE